MEIFFYGLLTLILATLIYFNVITTLILSQEKNSDSLQKRAKIIFVWLLPVIGFLFSLRFSRQIFENPLHDKLVPTFLSKWIYDDKTYNPNKNRDDKDLNGIHGISTYDHGSKK